MDYREKYLKLKRYILEDQRGSGKMNPLFVEQLSNLAFVVDNNILGDDAHAIILSLIEEFNRIAAIELKHNIELSQYYAPTEGIICENCEIVLKYVDTTVCITNGRVRQHITEENNKYYHTNKLGEKIQIDCNISRGLVRFYIKQKNGSTFKYTRIRIVNVQMIDSLKQYIDAIYQNNDEINKLEEATNIAISRGQADIISSLSQSGQLEANTSEGFYCATKTIGKISNEAKNAAVHAQMSKMNNQRIVSPVPTQSAVNAANTVANTIMKTNAANTNNMVTVLVPNNEPMPLQAISNIENVPAVIDSKGISTGTLGGSTNTMNSNIANSRSSLVVDANLAVVPTNNIINDESINVTPASTKSSTSIANKLGSATKTVLNKTGEIVSGITHKVKDLFTGKTAAAIATASVVPVSESLSVLTLLPPSEALTHVPSPQSNTDIIPTESQKTAIKRFENKLTRANGSSMSTHQTNQAAQTVKNGNYSVKQMEEITRTNQLLNPININDVSITSNRTIAGPSQNNLNKYYNKFV
jgi:hypothetical protein